MKSIKIKYLFLLLLFTTLQAQKIEYSVFSIPENLKENANSVVRSCKTDIQIELQKSMTIRSTRAVTILNEAGFGNLDATLYFDNNTKVKKVEGKIYDAVGVEVRKIKRSDFKDTSVNDGNSIFNDSRMLTLDYTPVGYPFTIVLETEIHTSNTVLIPTWFLVDNYFESIENTSVTIAYNPDLGFKWKEVNFSDEQPIDKVEIKNAVSFIAENITAIKKEEAAPSFLKSIPKVVLTIENFHLEGVNGHATNWEEFGAWYYNSLLKDTEELSEETQDKIKKLVENAQTPIEKAKLIYQYVQEKTRYVSIQVGIGGYKPMKAKDVDRLGYGDCKALTNYTRALLNVVDVPTYFTLVFADKNQKRDIQPDFVCMQGNHAILTLPVENENLWLECTSQTSPFAFQGSFTDDRNVLIIKPTGGEIVKTKLYTATENKKQTTGNYTLFENGDIQGRLTMVSNGLKYDEIYPIERQPNDEQIKYYKSYFSNLHNLKVSKINYTNDKTNIQFSEELELSAKGYGTINNKRLMFSLNAFDQNKIDFKKYKKRENSFEILRGCSSTDEITINLPPEYKIESLPTGTEIETKFGTYKTEVVLSNEKTVLYKRAFLLNEGLYSKTEYDEFRLFLEKVTRQDNARMILVRL